MPVPLFQVDAFADSPFTGNPAGVCLLREPRKPEWLQQVAREMNLAETAFLVRENDAFNLRWFTPTVEVDLCGHATLASAHVLWEQKLLQPSEPARFSTRSGLLVCRQTEAGIEMDFPAVPERASDAPTGLAEALGVRPVYLGRNKFDYLAEVDSEDTLRHLRPDHRFLQTLPVRGVIVTSRASMPGYDFVSRFFAPGSGVDEDPVTGSAHCCLGPFWQRRMHKSEFVAYQASARGGTVRVRVAGDRVFLTGRAITIFRAELFC
jgi:PhzF family phenazine biosynthesis protein